MDAKTSIVDVFASFLVLSYVKLLCVSFDLLVPVVLYNAKGESLGIYLYRNPSMKYFGSQHLPYGILAIVTTFLFILLPLVLLLLYPLKCFQRLLGNWQVLRMFIDSFQGSYKDGIVEGKFDCRYCSVLFFVMRIVLFVLYAFTLTGYFYAVAMIVLLLLMLFIAVVKPYKKALSHCVTLDVLFLTALAIWFGSVVSMMIANMKAVKSLQFSVVLVALLGVLPLLYVPILVLRRVLSSSAVRKTAFFLLYLKNRQCSQYADPFSDEDVCQRGNCGCQEQSLIRGSYGSIN